MNHWPRYPTTPVPHNSTASPQVCGIFRSPTINATGASATKPNRLNQNVVTIGWMALTLRMARKANAAATAAAKA